MATLQIDDTTKLIWSDALHYAWLAKNTPDRWDSSAYGRSVLVNGWIVIENLVAAASGCQDIGYSFKKKLDDHITEHKQTPVTWGSGWGQMALELIEERKAIIHKTSLRKMGDLFVEPRHTNEIIEKIRSVLDGIALHWSLEIYPWWRDDQYEDYKKESTFGFASVMIGSCKPGHCVEVGFRTGDEVRITAKIPIDENWEQVFEQQKMEIKLPHDVIFARKGGEVLREDTLLMRGAQQGTEPDDLTGAG